MKKCKEWLEKTHPDMHERLYSDGAFPILPLPYPLTDINTHSLTPPTHTFPAQSTPLTQLTPSTDAISASLATLSVDAQKRAAKDAQKKEAKAALAEARDAEKKQSAKVLIKRVERNKRKYVTAVSGLEAHGLDLKKVAKDFGKKFATGSSVTKTASGGEEIVVQGDLSDEIYDWITETYGDIPEENVDCIEDKKKKGGGG